MEHILFGRSVEDKGEGIFVSSDGGAWNRIGGVERLVDKTLSGLFEEDRVILLESRSKCEG